MYIQNNNKLDNTIFFKCASNQIYVRKGHPEMYISKTLCDVALYIFVDVFFANVLWAVSYQRLYSSYSAIQDIGSLEKLNRTSSIKVDMTWLGRGFAQWDKYFYCKILFFAQ